MVKKEYANVYLKKTIKLGQRYLFVRRKAQTKKGGDEKGGNRTKGKTTFSKTVT